MGRLTARLAHALNAWNAFRSQDETEKQIMTSQELGPVSSFRPERRRFGFANEKTIITAIYVRMSVDVASVPMRHVRLDSNHQYQEDVSSGLNDCLTVSANIDQTGRQFIQDAAATLFDEGVIAILPVDTTINPLTSGGYDINSMRVGRVMQWYPRHVRVRAYNDTTGIQQDVLMPKEQVAIVENPFYSVMNEPSSTLQRLLRKLSLLDAVDEQSASGSLDLIIQLPYVIKTDARRQEADKRLKEIEFQLKGSQYGIAYTDGTEKITQLNRPAENNLMGQIEYLTNLLYSQLGLTNDIMNGHAPEEDMLNYYNRTIEPVLAALADSMKRTFLTKTARSQGQSILFIRDPFKLVPVKDLAEIADKFRRNEVLTGDEMRGVIGFKPTNDPNAKKLQNPNIPVAYSTPPAPPSAGTVLGRPQLPPKSPIPQVPAVPKVPASSNGDNSQNGST